MKHAIETAGVSGHWPVFMGLVRDARRRTGLASSYENKLKLTPWGSAPTWHLALLAYGAMQARVKELFDNEH